MYIIGISTSQTNIIKRKDTILDSDFEVIVLLQIMGHKITVSA